MSLAKWTAVMGAKAKKGVTKAAETAKSTLKSVPTEAKTALGGLGAGAGLASLLEDDGDDIDNMSMKKFKAHQGDDDDSDEYMSKRKKKSAELC